MDTFDISIIGAGVIGLAVASEVSSSSRSVIILEKNASFGEESSSRNSEVIHAGLYYPRGSLKATACVEGRRMLYDLCPAQKIGCEKIGKIIVATDERELELLEHVRKTAAGNGVDLEPLTGEQVNKMEPYVRCRAALLSPETGIVDSHRLMEYFLDQARAQQADVVYQAYVKDLKKSEDGWRILIDNQGEQLEIVSRIVINCAGLQADQIAQAAGIDIKACGYEQYYLKGSYFRLSDKYRGATKRLLYPVPDKNSLGIHTVLDLNGGIRLGPDEEEVSQIDYHVEPGKRLAFFESVQRFLPKLAEDDLTPDMAGIRPQLRHPNETGFKDFIIREETDKNMTGLINCIGMESPGLTAAPFIGLTVARLVDHLL